MKKVWYLLIVCFSLFAYLPTYSDSHVSQVQYQEKPTLVLYYSPSCPYSQKVLMYLTSIHKTVPMKNVSENAQYREELKRLGGKSQVPCLMINDKPLYESDVIIQWLSDNREYLDNV